MVSESRVGNHQGILTDVSGDEKLPTDTGDLPEQNYGLSPSPLKFTPHVTPFYELGFPEPPCELMEDRAGVIMVDTISSSDGVHPQERVLFTRRAARILKKRERRNIDTQVPSDDPDQCYKGNTTERQRGLIITGFVPEEQRIIDQNHSPLAGENGEQVTWDAVITSYTRAVNLIFIRGRFSPEEADQYTQEFFLKIINKINHFNPEGKFSTWLLGCAENYCIDQIRRRGSEYKALSKLKALHPRSGDDSLEEEVISRLDAHLVSDALEKVPEKYREVLRLRYFEELPYSIIAEKLGIPESTVKTRLFKGRKFMSRIIEEERLTYDRR